MPRYLLRDEPLSLGLLLEHPVFGVVSVVGWSNFSETIVARDVAGVNRTIPILSSYVVVEPVAEPEPGQRVRRLSDADPPQIGMVLRYEEPDVGVATVVDMSVNLTNITVLNEHGRRMDVWHWRGIEVLPDTDEPSEGYLTSGGLQPSFGMVVEYPARQRSVIVNYDETMIRVEKANGEKQVLFYWENMRVWEMPRRIREEDLREGALITHRELGRVRVISWDWGRDYDPECGGSGAMLQKIDGSIVARNDFWNMARTEVDVLMEQDIERRLVWGVKPQEGMVLSYCGNRMVVLDPSVNGQENLMLVRQSGGTVGRMLVDENFVHVGWAGVPAKSFVFMRPCDECGEQHYLREFTEVKSGAAVCPSCLEKRYERCAECGEFVPVEDIYDNVCEECHDELYRDCDMCGDEHLVENMIDVNGGYYCRRCIDNNFAICDCCESYIPLDESRYDDASDRTLCPDCWENEMGDDEFCLHDHDYAPRLIFHGDLESESETSETGSETMYYGIELEIECKGYRDVESVAHAIEDETEHDWCLKRDGSLEHGIEVVSQPRTFKSWQAFWPTYEREMLRLARDRGCTAHDNGRCGMHVHTSLDAWEGDQLFRLFSLVYSQENYRRILTVSQRKKAQLDQWASLSLLDVGANKDRIESKRSPFDTRYAALNVTDKTLEIRIFRSSMRLDRIQKNLEFVHALYCYTKEAKRKVSWQGLLRWIERHKRTVEHLRAFLIEQGMLEEKRSATKIVADVAQSA